MVSAQPRDSPLCILLRRQRGICRKVVGDVADWLEFRQILKTPPPKARRVLSGPSTRPADHADTAHMLPVPLQPTGGRKDDREEQEAGW
jgi:hypothetical protein